MNQNIRNVAIIAHVDHGKTTLVDAILKQTGIFRANQVVTERIMDSNDLERERGITILSKNTAIEYQGCKINIVDTPGHADFGGEVERVLGMVDGVLLVVDAFEGPMPQTRFVLSKALNLKLKPIVVINKMDRPDARPDEVVDEVLDLFISLGADEVQIEFPVIYANGRDGLATKDLNSASVNIYPLLDEILETIPEPTGNISAPLQLQISALDYDDYVGRIAIGTIKNGKLNKGDLVTLSYQNGKQKEVQITSLYTFSGLNRIKTDEVGTGDIVAIAGIEDINIGDTLTDRENPRPLPAIKVDEPTLTMTFRVNDSPFAGKDGRYLTSRHLRDRLYKELQTNMSLRVEDTQHPDVFKVSGRGELHLSILIETMRREGYELAVSKPEVIMQNTEKGILEPLELLIIDTPEQYLGQVMERIGPRKGEMQNMTHQGDRIKLEIVIPARGLLGLRPELLTITRGHAIMYHSFLEYGEYKGEIPIRQQGALVAWETGISTTYALLTAQQRGTLFISPGEEVYTGQVIGENSREQDLDINVCKKKQVTNMRSSTSEETVHLTPPRQITLEKALEWISPDELVEITPERIRIRKAMLNRHERQRKRGE